MKTTSNLRSKKAIGYGTLALGLLCLFAFKTFKGSPVWPKKGAFHYIATLDPATFPLNSTKQWEALNGLADWRNTLGTSFSPGYNRKTIGWGKHNDGYNAWIWLNSNDASLLGMTSVWYRGKTLIDCDIFFNSNPKIKWGYKMYDPTLTRTNGIADFRSVARHEAGHAIGFDHETAWLSLMNPYMNNHNLPYASNLGMMPHADDKNGVRTLYPSTQKVHNMMATCWAAPLNGKGGVRLLKAKGTYMGGTNVTVPLTVENQGNLTELGGSKGVQFAIYLSTNRIFSSYDTRLGSFYFGGNLGRHMTWSGSVSLKIPTAVKPGKYYLGVIIDDKNIIQEQFESDNAAELGLITVNQLPDLICTKVTSTTSRVPRGSRFAARVTVKNQGLGASKACSGDMFLSYIKAWPFPGRDYTIGPAALPALLPGASATITVPLTMPAGLCGERLYSLAFYADSTGINKETNETNQVGYGQVTCTWPTTPKNQWLAGTVRGNIDSVGSRTAFPVCTKYTGSLPSNSFFLWLWGATGTKPGIPVPGVGTLALNYDAVTQISLGFHNSYFKGMLGAQAWNARGSIGYIQGGMWLKPLWNRKTNLAVVWFVPGKKFLAVTQTPINMFVRKPLQ